MPGRVRTPICTIRRLAVTRPQPWHLRPLRTRPRSRLVVCRHRPTARPRRRRQENYLTVNWARPPNRQHEGSFSRQQLGRPLGNGTCSEPFRRFSEKTGCHEVPAQFFNTLVDTPSEIIPPCRCTSNLATMFTIRANAQSPSLVHRAWRMASSWATPEHWDMQGRLQVIPTGDPVADRGAAVAAHRGDAAGLSAARGRSGTLFRRWHSVGPLLAIFAFGRWNTRDKTALFSDRPGRRVFHLPQLRACGRSREFLDSAIGLVSWTESLALTGGGPQFGYLLTLNGPPQKQLLRQQTTFKATQQGEAVGLTDYPPCSRSLMAGRRT